MFKPIMSQFGKSTIQLQKFDVQKNIIVKPIIIFVIMEFFQL